MNTYQLMPAATIIANQALINANIQAAIRLVGGGGAVIRPVIQIEQMHGWISYRSDGLLQTRRRPAIPESEARALAAANRYVAALNNTFRAINPAATFGIPTYFANINIGSAQIFPVRSVGGNFFDHYMITYQMQMSMGPWGNAPVHGSVLELMINTRDACVGLHCRWRPAAAAPTILAPNTIAGVSMEYDPDIVRGTIPDMRIARRFKIQYLLPDGTATGNQLLPYYVDSFPASNFGDFVPAAGPFFSVNIGITPSVLDPNLSTLTANIVGGSTQYRYDWMAWRSDKIQAEWMYDLGSNPQATIDLSSNDSFYYQVYLRVTDRITGAMVQVTQMLRSSGSAVSAEFTIPPPGILFQMRKKTPSLIHNQFRTYWEIHRSLDRNFFDKRPPFTIGNRKQAANLNPNTGQLITTIFMARMSVVEPIGWLPNQIPGAPGPGGGWVWAGDPNIKVGITPLQYITLQNFTGQIINTVWGGRTYRNPLGRMAVTNTNVRVIDAEPMLMVPPLPGGMPAVGPAAVMAYINLVQNFINAIPPDSIFVFVGTGGRSTMAPDNRPGSRLNGQIYIGHWNINQCIAPSTTPAHEFGHTLGLQDRYNYYQRISISTDPRKKADERRNLQPVIIPLVASNPPFGNRGCPNFNPEGWNTPAFSLHIDPNTNPANPGGTYNWVQSMGTWYDEDFDEEYYPELNMYAFDIQDQTDPVYKVTELQVQILMNPRWYESVPQPQVTFFGSCNVGVDWIGYLGWLAARTNAKEIRDYQGAGARFFPLAILAQRAKLSDGVRQEDTYRPESRNRWRETYTNAATGNISQLGNTITGKTPAERYTVDHQPFVPLDRLISWGNSQLQAPSPIHCPYDTQTRISWNTLWNYMPPDRNMVQQRRFDFNYLLQGAAPNQRDRLFRGAGFPRIYTPNPAYGNYFPNPAGRWTGRDYIPFWFNRIFIDLPYLTNQINQIL